MEKEIIRSGPSSVTEEFETVKDENNGILDSSDDAMEYVEDLEIDDSEIINSETGKEKDNIPNTFDSNDYPDQIDEDTVADDANESELKETEEDPTSAEAESLGMYMREIGKGDFLTAEEEIELGKRVQEGDIEARNILVERRPQARGKYRKKISGPGVPFQDLLQEGNIGLLKAAEKYDYKKGVRFTTYASWWIKQGIVRSIANDGRAIRIPVHMNDKYNRYVRTYNKLNQENAGEPTVKEVADEMGIPESELRNLLKNYVNIVSLNQKVGEDEDSELGDMVSNTQYMTIDKEIEQNALKKELQKVMDAALTDREKEVLKLRFGMDGNQEHTLEAVGKKMHVTRERIRQIESTALRKLKRPNKKVKLVDFLRN